MSGSTTLHEFLDAAKRQGTSDESLVGLLRGRGWSEEDAYRALADHYEGQSGLQVPSYKRSGTAKDAFFYVLSFTTLLTWTLSVGSILFSFIERWVKDPLEPPNYYSGVYGEIAYSLACLIVVFPVYLFVMRHILRELERHPEKLDSGLRKWLIYMALFITAGVIISDLIEFLSRFLRGDLTARFVAKVSVVLVIAGGVLWYYLGSLKKSAARLKNANE